MKVEMNKPFKLPFVSKRDFIDMMRSGLRYESGRGFFITSLTDIKAVNNILRKYGFIIDVLKECVLCKKYVDCSSCKFESVCIGQDQTTCICNACYSKHVKEHSF